MQFATLNKFFGCVLVAVLTTGCVGKAGPAPELPRYVSQTSEAGYITNTSAAASDSRINVTTSAMAGLTPDEQQRLLAMDGVRVLLDDQYGIITDAQGVDQSTPGTRGGAAMGGVLASAGYLDHALGGGNYSAINQLAIGLLGAAAGSTLDSSATSRFQFRYAVKLGDGDIKYFDEIKSTAFRHAVGVCVLVPALQLVSQRICNQTGDSIRKSHLAK